MLERSSIVNGGRSNSLYQWVRGHPITENKGRKIPLPHTPEGGFVTICVAAIAGGNCIYGASDRMITAWTTEFEPNEPQLEKVLPQPLKSIALSNSIVAMIAGDDMSLQSQLIYDLGYIVSERIKKDQQNWWTVSDIAHQYRRLYGFKRNQIIEQKILEPRGLTYETFLSKQRELDEKFLATAHSEIARFRLPDLAVIFAGIDPTGAHLYVVRNGEVACEDLVGFAAIGSGYWHAESQFMATGHTKHSSLSSAVYVTYAAKRRAELAPGVGRGTDMFGIGPQLGSYFPIAPSIIGEFETIYEAAQKSAKKAWEKEKTSIQKLMTKWAKEAEEKAKTQTSGEGGSTPIAS